MNGLFGLAAFGFWMFIGAAAVAGIWDGGRKKPERDLKVGGLIVVFI